jgi:hypothetical protein
MTRGLVLISCFLAMLSALITGCASGGGSVHYQYGAPYYDPWYRYDVIVQPPPPGYRPRPEQPIYKPPPARPTPLPARPMPRPGLR